MLLLATFAVVMMSGQAWAVIYKYIDAQGTPTYVDDLHHIPEQYRKKAVLVRGEFEKEMQIATAEHAAAAGDEATGEAAGGSVVSESGRRGSFSGRLARSILILLAAIACYLGAVHVLTKKKMLRYRSFVKAVVIAIASVSVLYLHAVDILKGVFSAANAIQGIKEESEQKGKNAATFIKALDKISSGEVPVTTGEDKSEKEPAGENHP